MGVPMDQIFQSNDRRIAGVLIAGNPTMQTLLEWIEDDGELSPTQKRDLGSATRRFCELLQLDPSNTPARKVFFRHHLSEFHPKQAGLSNKPGKISAPASAAH